MTDLISKHTIYVVVSISSLVSGQVPTSTIEGYFGFENSAKAEAEKLSTWKTAAVMPYEVTINDFVRLLNSTKGLIIS